MLINEIRALSDEQLGEELEKTSREIAPLIYRTDIIVLRNLLEKVRVSPLYRNERSVVEVRASELVTALKEHEIELSLPFVVEIVKRAQVLSGLSVDLSGDVIFRVSELRLKRRIESLVEQVNGEESLGDLTVTTEGAETPKEGEDDSFLDSWIQVPAQPRLI